MSNLVAGYGLSRLRGAAGPTGPIVAAAGVLAFAAVALWQGDGGSDVAASDGYVTLPTGQGAARPGPIGATPGAGGYYGETEGRDFVEALRLGPGLPRMGTTGYEITAQTDRELLSRFGLKPGDVLLEVDNDPLDDARMAGLSDELAALGKVEIAYERDGRYYDTRLTFERR